MSTCLSGESPSFVFVFLTNRKELPRTKASVYSESSRMKAEHRVPVSSQATSPSKPEMPLQVSGPHSLPPTCPVGQGHTGPLIPAVLSAEERSPEHTHVRGKPQGSARAGRGQGVDKPSPFGSYPPNPLYC